MRNGLLGSSVGRHFLTLLCPLGTICLCSCRLPASYTHSASVYYYYDIYLPSYLFSAAVSCTVQANMNFVPIRSTDLLSPYFGQTEAAIRNLFAQARAAAPCLLFFDEFDALAYKRCSI